MSKRILSFLLAVVMLALAIPAMALTAFAADSAANAAPSVSTTFSAASGNFPDYKIDGEWNMAYNLDFKGGWSFGTLTLTTPNPATLNDIAFGTNPTLLEYNARNHYNNDLGDFISSGSNGWNGGSDSSPVGCVCFMPDGGFLLVSGTRTDSTGITVQKNQTSLRYTAQYAGNVTVTVDGEWFDYVVHQNKDSSYADLTVDYAHIFVLKNGTLIKDIKRGEDIEVYETISTTLAKGDTLDFVAVMDPEYSTADESSTKTAWKREAANRNFIVDAITVNYTSVTVENATASSKLNGISAAGNSVTYAYDSEEVRFFQWYDANDNPINAGGQLSAGCYAKLNPEMVAAAGIDLANDTYAKAYEKYLNLLMKANTLNKVNSDWSLGHMTPGGTFSELIYPIIHVGKNLGLVGSDGKVGYPCDAAYNGTLANAGQGSLYVARSSFDTSYAALKSAFATYVPDDSVKAGTVNVAYNDAMKSLVLGEARHNITVMPMGRFQANTRGGSGWGYAAYRYTAPYTGTVTFVVDAFDGQSGGTMSWNVVKNGAVSAATDTVTNWQTALDSYKSAVAAMTFQVVAGDTIDFLYAESSGADGFRPTITATMEYNPFQYAVEGQLKIDSNYSLGMYVKPVDVNGVLSAVVGGRAVTGEEQDNGSYYFPLKSNIFITDLTSTVVSYTLKETSNGHVITTSGSLDANAVLTAYENHSVAEISRLAKDIRQLAEYVNFKLGKSAEPSAAARTDMKRNDTELAALSRNYTFGGTAGAFKIVGANVNYDDSLRLLLLVDAANGGDAKWDLLSGYTMKAYSGQTALNLKTSEFGSVEANGQKYVAVMVEVPVAYWNQQITFVVEHNGVAVSRSLNYSHNTWCAYVYQVKGGNGAYSDAYLARGVYNVGKSAAAYLEYVANNA